MADSKSFARILAATALMFGLLAVSQPAHALSLTFGALDSVTTNANGTATVSGWAATSDNKTQALGVRAVIDNQFVYAPNSYRFANKYRPDVAANVCCGYSAYLGFTFTIPWPVDNPGSHKVCIEAQNSGVYNVISCLPENIPGRTNPILSKTTLDYLNYIGGTYDLFPGSAVNLTYYRPVGTYDAAIDAAMLDWARSGTNIYLTRTTNAAVANLQFNIVPDIGSGGRGDENSGALCSAFPIGNVKLGCIRGKSTIRLATNVLGTDQANVQKTAGHEAGHAFGLGHPPAGQTSIMNTGPVAPVVPKTSSTTDWAKINILYPRNSGDSA
jgi:hypothetical protein